MIFTLVTVVLFIAYLLWVWGNLGLAYLVSRPDPVGMAKALIKRGTAFRLLLDVMMLAKEIKDQVGGKRFLLLGLLVVACALIVDLYWMGSVAILSLIVVFFGLPELERKCPNLKETQGQIARVLEKSASS